MLFKMTPHNLGMNYITNRLKNIDTESRSDSDRLRDGNLRELDIGPNKVRRPTSVTIIDGEEGSARIVRQRQDVGVRVLHGDAPALHARRAHLEARILHDGRLLGRHGL